MSDKHIIKALECCTGANAKMCGVCPLGRHQDCEYVLQDEALALLKRQQAEIERLEGFATNMEYCANHALDKIEKEKREAIKDFAERLKAKVTYFEYRLEDGDELFKAVELDAIDAIVEEMCGENEENP